MTQENNKELETLLLRIKELSAILLSTPDEEPLNEENVSKLGNELDSLTKIAGDIFTDSFSLSPDSNIIPMNQPLELRINKTTESSTQTIIENYEGKFDRKEPLARIICQALKQAVDDKTSSSEINIEEEFPLAVNLDDDKYFIGFCSHTKGEKEDEIISKPKYGLLFTPNEFMSESLYIGKLNDKGEAQSESSLYFQDLNFEDENVTNFFPHDIPSNDLNKYRSYYKGGFEENKFHGQGEYVNIQPENLAIDLPFLIPHDQADRMFKSVTVLGEFSNGQIDGEVTINFTNDEHKKKKYPISFYSGCFEDGVFNTNGKLTFSNGDEYEGEFNAGKRHGKGKYTSEKYIFDGEWEDDLMNGTFKVELRNESNTVLEDVKINKGVPEGD